jgi:ABC-type polysaccharide/polyol phosphate transport system ATPase subunit
MSSSAMSEPAIRFDQVSKRYRLRPGIREEFARMARRAMGRTVFGENEFWALKNVSFAIDRGETVGLIGPNGAGKSTILKILSRVTVPTTGRYTARGRVGALIEVGAGFHPDLTGRENVYLNGAIMGMSKAEIDAKFDQIVAFSEVEKFLDTPLKFYSSGMMVRLGFAVAAHIEPDILLVDEVLAVGDSAFQAKCLNRIAELKEQDKTIVLVSHTMPSILQHSSRVLWIDHGEVQGYGDPEQTVEGYLRTVHRASSTPAGPDQPATSDSPIRIISVTVRNAAGDANGTVAYGQPATVDVQYSINRPLDGPVVGLTFHDVRDYPLGGLTSRLDGIKLDGSVGTRMVSLVLSPVLFTRGSYSVTAAIHDTHIRRYLDMRPRAATFMVDGPSVSTREVSGHLVMPHHWEIGTLSLNDSHGQVAVTPGIG